MSNFHENESEINNTDLVTSGAYSLSLISLWRLPFPLALQLAVHFTIGEVSISVRVRYFS
jgi:hypothetical protein